MPDYEDLNDAVFIKLVSLIFPFTSQVRKRLMQKQIGQQISEKVKKIRDIKKYGKKVQVEVEQQKQKDKREMLEQIKKFRKVRKANTIKVS